MYLHEQMISRLYFAYEVTSSVFMRLPEEIEAPGLTTCYRFFEIMDFDRMNRETGSKLKHSIDDKRFWDYEKILTLGQILKYTPPVEKAIDRCRYRRPQSFTIEEKVGQDCYQLFSVRKFFVLQYVCYQYEYVGVKDQLYAYEHLTSSPVAPGFMYKIYPGPLFHKYRLAKFMVTEPGLYPYQTVKFTPEVDRGTDKGSPLHRNRLAYHELKQDRLPPPFVTECFNYSRLTTTTETQVDCHQECVMEKTLKEMNLVAFSSIATPERKDQQDKLLMGWYDTQDERKVSQLIGYYNECNSQCPHKDCREVLVFTQHSSEENYRLSFIIMAPNEPWTYVAFKPAIDFAEYMSFSLGCIGTWFGLSALSFDPFQFLMERGKKKRNKKLTQNSFNEKMYKEMQLLRMAMRHMEKSTRNSHYFNRY